MQLKTINSEVEVIADQTCDSAFVYDESQGSPKAKVDRPPVIGGKKRGRENTDENAADQDVVEFHPATRLDKRPTKRSNYAGVTLVAEPSLTSNHDGNSLLLSSQGMAKSPRDLGEAEPFTPSPRESQLTLAGTQPTVTTLDDVRGSLSPMDNTPSRSSVAKGKGVAPGEKQPFDFCEVLHCYSISIERLQFSSETTASEGAFGSVRKATLLPAAPSLEPIMVAVKTLKTGRTTPEQLERVFKRELLVLTSIQHPNIIQFIGYHLSRTDLKACFITDWAENGDVFTFMKESDAQPDKLRLITDVTEALSYLHSRNITHGDIKAQNVLINNKMSAQLCDFGLAQLQDNPDFPTYEGSSQFAGSLRWCSPEFLTDGIRNPAQDVWAWAWFVWEILTGLIPYFNVTNEARVVFTIMMTGKSALPDFSKHPEINSLPRLGELLPRCWEKDVAQRVQIDECLNVVKSLTHLVR